MTARPDIAWSRQLAGTSRAQAVLWAGAAAFMLTAHAGAAWLVLREMPEPPVQEAGSPAIEVDLAALGFTTSDQVSAGETTETAQPVESDAAELVPHETTQTETATPVETARAVETPRVERAEPVEEPARPVEVTPQEPVRSETAPSPSPRLAEAASEVEIAARPPTETEPETAVDIEAAQPLEPETVEPVEEEVAAIVNVPLPTPRPEYTPPAPRAEPQRTERPRREQPRQQAQRPAAGNQGQNQADARRGSSQGSAQGRAANETAGNQRNSAAGNAAVSNYPGQVRRKLTRAVRYRGRDRGEVLVSFTVSQSGGVTSARISRGSGSANLDQAALDAIRRAAPFPPIPSEAGRASWDFQLPVSFTR